MECMGFDAYGTQVTSTHGKLQWDQIANRSQKLVTFLDLAGHEKYLKTTVFGLSSSQPDYAMLMIGANAGCIGMTKEHLGLTLLLNIPSLIIITKIDMAPEHILKQTMSQLFKVLKHPSCKKMPMLIRSTSDVIKASQSFNERICPVFQVSNVTGDGIALLKLFLNLLPPRWIAPEGNHTLYEITESFNVPGVGCVVSGQLMEGQVRVGDTVRLGPDKNGHFVTTMIKGIHRKRVPVDVAYAGQGVSIALKKIKRSMLRKGMVLVDLDVPLKAHVTREFEAEIVVLHHSTTININYQTMLHTRRLD